jgi:hypothetical protein
MRKKRQKTFRVEDIKQIAPGAHQEFCLELHQISKSELAEVLRVPISPSPQETLPENYRNRCIDGLRPEIKKSID